MAEEKNLNLDDEFSFEIKPTKSTVAAVAAGILVVVAGFLAYNIFSKPTTPTTLTSEPAQEQQEQPVASENKDNVSDQEQTAPSQPASETAPATKQTPSEATTTNTSTWTPLAHAAGTISGSTYTVRSGDTLWEIARGRYGSGYKWHLIAKANGVKNSALGYPLIYPGQVLSLPNE